MEEIQPSDSDIILAKFLMNIGINEGEDIRGLTTEEKMYSFLGGLYQINGVEPTPDKIENLIQYIKSIIFRFYENEINCYVIIANYFLSLLKKHIESQGIPIVHPPVTSENLQDFFEWFKDNYTSELISRGIKFQQDIASPDAIIRQDLWQAHNSGIEQRQREELQMQINAYMAAAAAYERDRITHIHTASGLRNAASNQEGNDRMRYLSAADEEERKAIMSQNKVEEENRKVADLRKTLEEMWTTDFTQFPRKGGYKRKNSKKKHLNKKNKTRNKNKNRNKYKR